MHCVLRGELKNNKFFVCRNNRIILPKRREDTKHNANWSAKKNEQCKDAMNAFYCILENLFSFRPLFLLRCGCIHTREMRFVVFGCWTLSALVAPRFVVQNSSTEEKKWFFWQSSKDDRLLEIRVCFSFSLPLYLSSHLLCIYTHV